MTVEAEVCYFSVARYVPDPIRDEARNIGVLVVSPGTGQWATRFDLSKTHLPTGSEKLRRLQLVVQTFQRELPAQAGIDPRDRLLSLHEESTNTIQFTAPNAALGSPTAVLKELYWERVAVRHPGGAAFTASSARTKLTSEFHRIGTPIESIVSQPVVQVGADRYDFDLGVRNGHLVAVLDVLSFRNADVLRVEQKAGWFAHVWEAVGSKMEAEAHVILEPAEGGDARKRYERGKRWIEEAGAQTHRVDQFSDLAAQLTRRLVSK